MTALTSNPTVGMTFWLLVSTALFAIALFGILTRRNMIGVLMAVEIALNSVALNFVVFNKYYAGGRFDGQIMAMFIIAVAAAEAVTAIGIFVAFYRSRRTVDVTDGNLLRD